MSEIIYCEINPNKKYRTLQVLYNSAQTQTEDVKEWVGKRSLWQKLDFTSPYSTKLQEKLPAGEIVTMSFDGFEVDTNKMETGRVYQLTYDDSEYELVKNSKNELVISEVG